MNIYTKFTPTSFDEIVGNKQALMILRSIIDRKESFTGDLAFIGPSSVGRTTAAKIFSESMGFSSKIVDPEDDQAMNDISLHVGVRGVSSSVIITNANKLSSKGCFDIQRVRLFFSDPVMFIYIIDEDSPYPQSIRNSTIPIPFSKVPNLYMQTRIESVLENINIPFDSEAVGDIVYNARGLFRSAYDVVTQAILVNGTINTNIVQALSKDDLDPLFTSFVDSIYMCDMILVDRAIDSLHDYFSTPHDVINGWINFEIGLLAGKKRANFIYNHSEEDTLTRLEMLWFLSNKMLVTTLDPRLMLRLGAILLGARLTGRLMSEEDALALLGV